MRYLPLLLLAVIPEIRWVLRPAITAFLLLCSSNTKDQFPSSYLHELHFFLEAGYTPMETPIAATRTGAEILGMQDKLGTLQEGKLADLIVTDRKSTRLNSSHLGI